MSGCGCPPPERETVLGCERCRERRPDWSGIVEALEFLVWMVVPTAAVMLLVIAYSWMS